MTTALIDKENFESIGGQSVKLVFDSSNGVTKNQSRKAFGNLSLAKNKVNVGADLKGSVVTTRRALGDVKNVKGTAKIASNCGGGKNANFDEPTKQGKKSFEKKKASTAQLPATVKPVLTTINESTAVNVDGEADEVEHLAYGKNQPSFEQQIAEEILPASERLSNVPNLRRLLFTPQPKPTLDELCAEDPHYFDRQFGTLLEDAQLPSDAELADILANLEKELGL